MQSIFLGMFGIGHPDVTTGVRFVGDTIGVCTTSEVTPTLRRHRTDNVGAAEGLASMLQAS